MAVLLGIEPKVRSSELRVLPLHYRTLVQDMGIKPMISSYVVVVVVVLVVVLVVLVLVVLVLVVLVVVVVVP